MPLPPNCRRFAHAAMHTRFEVILADQAEAYAAQAAAAAFDELDRLESELSRFVPSSDIARINALAPGEAARVGEATFECLALAARVWSDTGGAFDVTVGALADCWKAVARGHGAPPPETLAAASARVGMQRLELDAREHLVRLKAGATAVDLGAIGKGYAVDHMVALLREWGIATALVHGGESSLYALGATGWPVCLADPQRPAEALGHLQLQNRALSGSSVADARHIVDPRTGRPVTQTIGAWALAPTAALADALSTAFLVMSVEEMGSYCVRHPDCAGLRALADAAAPGPHSWNWPLP